MRKITEYDIAKEESEKIKEFLIKNFPNQKISKGSLRAKFKLSNSRCQIVFNLLEESGLIVDTRTVMFVHS